MGTYIALLRGINVGGHKKILMDDLVKIFKNVGCKDIRTYIQSGNVVFSSKSDDREALVGLIRLEMLSSLGFDTEIILRSKAEWIQIIGSNPFFDDMHDINSLYVIFLKDLPADFRILEDKRGDFEEEFFISGKELYFYYPKGFRLTKINNNFIEKTLKVTATARNWKSCLKIGEIIQTTL